MNNFTVLDKKVLEFDNKKTKTEVLKCSNR